MEKKEEEEKSNSSSENDEKIKNPNELIDKEKNTDNYNENLKSIIGNKKFHNLNEEETNNNDITENEENMDESGNKTNIKENDISGFEYEDENPYQKDIKVHIDENNKEKNEGNENNNNIAQIPNYNINIKSSNNMKSKEKEINKNTENNSYGKLNKNFFQENKLKNDIIIPQKIIINSNIPKISYIHERSSDYDPQYEIYIEYPEDGDGQNLDSDIKGKDSIKASGAQIANTIMGAGILSIPIIMRYLGLLLGIIFIIFLAFCTIYSVFILIRCHEITGKNGFSMLGKITMGKFGSILIKVIIIINNLGFCIAYFRIFGEVVQTIIQGWVSPESFWANNWHNFIYIIICSFIMFSFIFIKNLSALKKVAYMGVSVVLIFSFGLTLLFIHKGIHHYLDSNISWIFLKPNCSFSEAFHVIPSVFLAFLFQFNVFPIYLSLKEKNLETMMKATKIGVGYSLFIFLIVGIVGFLLYGLNMNDTLLNNFSDDMTKFRDISGFIKFLIIIISVSFVTTCLTSFPILYLSLRENFVNSLIFCMKNMNIKEKKDNNKNFISEKGLLIITVVLYILIIVMAIVLPKLKTIFSIVGATAGTFIAFILPNLFYIRICKISKKNYNLFLPMFFFGLGVFFLFISFIVSFI